MKRLPLVLMILFLATFNIATQTTKNSKTTAKKTTTTTAKTATPTKTPTAVATPTNTAPPKIVEKANTPANLTGLETEILAEINKMRSNPAEYAKMLETYLKTFKGKESTTPDGVNLITNEGAAPVAEAIAALKASAPLPEFKAIDGMTKAAKDHALDLIKNDMSGHRGSDGSMPDTRVAKYGSTLLISENISYYTATPKAIILAWLVDDGLASRSHRKNLLNPNYKLVGIATGENKTYKNFCIMLFTDKFTEGKSGLKSF